MGWLSRLLATAPVVVVLAVAAGMLLLGAQPAAADPPDVVSGVAAAALPALARQSLPLISDLTATSCPELPPLWVVSQVQAESGWDASQRSGQAGGVAGLYQLSQPSWTAAGGSPWAADPPVDGAAVLSPEEHLRVAIPWVCANLRAATAHLAATGKPAAPLDAMLVCHIAGCARVTGSRTGIPAPGEAGCDARCVQLIHRYIAAVHDNLTRFAAPMPEAAAPMAASTASPPSIPQSAAPLLPGLSPSGRLPLGRPAGTQAAPDTYAVAPANPFAAGTPAGGSAGSVRLATPAIAAAWRGGATGCNPPDPTGNGCLTGATRHGLDAVSAAFGGWHDGPVVHSAGCWDRHAWNPSSDHSRGKACDFMMTRPGTFATGTELDNGWRVADWLRANAGPLQVKYLIWQGRYWDPSVRDDPGNWGTRYTGAGIYDVRSATGGHYDHVHASFRE